MSRKYVKKQKLQNTFSGYQGLPISCKYFTLCKEIFASWSAVAALALRCDNDGIGAYSESKIPALTTIHFAHRRICRAICQDGAYRLSLRFRLLLSPRILRQLCLKLRDFLPSCEEPFS
jgi:hypothetical protein